MKCSIAIIVVDPIPLCLSWYMWRSSNNEKLKFTLTSIIRVLRVQINFYSSILE